MAGISLETIKCALIFRPKLGFVSLRINQDLVGISCHVFVLTSRAGLASLYHFLSALPYFYILKSSEAKLHRFPNNHSNNTSPSEQFKRVKPITVDENECRNLPLMWQDKMEKNAYDTASICTYAAPGLGRVVYISCTAT